MTNVTQTRMLTVNLDERIHTALRIAAEREDRTVASFVRTTLRDKLASMKLLPTAEADEDIVVHTWTGNEEADS